MSVPPIAAVLGAGTIGSGWAALFAAHGALVRVFDPDLRARERVREALEGAAAIGLAARAEVLFVPDARSAVADAGWVQESIPESRPLKRALFDSIAGAVPTDAVVASSASSLTPGELMAGHPLASRFIIAHPLHPVYAVPTVELCAADETSRDTLRHAGEMLRALGREPVVVRVQLAGLISNRLTAALLREALDIVARGAATAEEVDAVIARGIATGWLAAGAFGTEAAADSDAHEPAAAAERVQAQLGALWRSLATWEAPSQAQLEALERALAERRGALPDQRSFAMRVAGLLGG